MRKFFREFRDFIQKGNVLDLAVGMLSVVHLINSK